MTPKEKAEELVNKFYQKVADGAYPEENAKDCALIAIDEILQTVDDDNWNFYKQVQEEIEKL